MRILTLRQRQRSEHEFDHADERGCLRRQRHALRHHPRCRPHHVRLFDQRSALLDSCTLRLLPIYRVKNWESAKLFNLMVRSRLTAKYGLRLTHPQTTTQKNCFWAAVFFFGAVWLLLLYRLINVILFAIIVPRRTYTA